jgi:hypothetical protein
MSLRIVDDPAQFDAALAALQSGLKTWAGGAVQAWRAQSALEHAREGESYARRDDLHLYVETTFDKAMIGVALTERDEDLLRLDFMREAPARRKRRLAIAAAEGGEFYLLIGVDLLADQEIRDPAKRLPAAAGVRRAELGGRDYLLYGPLSEPRVADALQATAGLSPRFERHIARLGALLADEDDVMEGASLYPIRREIARAHKIERRIVAALHERLSAASYRFDAAGAGPIKADFAMSRGADKLAFEVRGHAEIADLVRGVGQLALVAAHGRARILVLPAPLAGADGVLTSFAPALNELSISVLFYALEHDELRFMLHHADPALSAEARAALV